MEKGKTNPRGNLLLLRINFTRKSVLLLFLPSQPWLFDKGLLVDSVTRDMVSKPKWVATRAQITLKLREQQQKQYTVPKSRGNERGEEKVEVVVVGRGVNSKRGRVTGHIVYGRCEPNNLLSFCFMYGQVGAHLKSQNSKSM